MQVRGRLAQGYERHLDTVEVAGSNPASPTKQASPGLPRWVDRYAYPRSWAARPADNTVLFDRRGLPPVAVTFGEYLDTVAHEQAVPRSLAERRALQAALIPIAAKRIARRSPDTPRMIELVGSPMAAGGTWESYLVVLRGLLGRYTATGNPGLIAATHAYLDLVGATLG